MCGFSSFLPSLPSFRESFIESITHTRWAPMLTSHLHIKAILILTFHQQAKGYRSEEPEKCRQTIYCCTSRRRHVSKSPHPERMDYCRTALQSPLLRPPHLTHAMQSCGHHARIKPGVFVVPTTPPLPPPPPPPFLPLEVPLLLPLPLPPPAFEPAPFLVIALFSALFWAPFWGGSSGPLMPAETEAEAEEAVGAKHPDMLSEFCKVRSSSWNGVVACSAALSP